MVKNNGNIKIADAWDPLLHDEFLQPYFTNLEERVQQEYSSKKVYPHSSRMFRAFLLSPPENVKVVILGQDPYHTPGVADGLAFSSFPNNPIPPSLLNIYKEIESEFGCVCPHTPDLTHWAEQGVLLLNSSLTVEAGIANSHATIGWNYFTDAVMSLLSKEYENIVFILWGNFARSKGSLIDSSKHLVLQSAHPSPLSAHRGFMGNNHFKDANKYLQKNGKMPIAWC